MDVSPSRLLGTLLGGIILIVVLGGVVLGIFQLATAPISIWMVLWVLFPAAGVPLALLIAYRLYGLLTSQYQLDRNGFYLKWGLASEQIPLARIKGVHFAKEIAAKLSPGRSLWWPGCVVGKKEVEGVGLVELFATTGVDGLVVVRADDRWIGISPPDPEAFHMAFHDATRMGALELIPELSVRPDFVLTQVWSDRVARFLVLTGIGLPLLLLGYLAFRIPGLPDQVPFGFDPSGSPMTPAPPGRLLLLPMIGAFSWMVDFIAGAWLYRRTNDRSLAYTVWSVSSLLGALLWGASLHLLARA